MITPSTPTPALRLPAFIVVMLFLLSAAWLPAQIQDRPQVGPEQKRLEAWVGKWKYEGTLHKTPFAAGGKFAGKQTLRMVLDSLYLQVSGEDKGVYDGKEITYKAMRFHWYDAESKLYRERGFDNDGFVSEGTATVSGNVWVSTSSMSEGKAKGSLSRSTTTFSADGKQAVTKGELSMDGGKTWIPWWDQTMTKIGR